ncbi:transferase hexapeptide (six repeat-containing protein) [Tistlia consotensis]|uniref:Transferase hexapeptide (Six repeat-containing protein) n=1 Tax=Tistlia consotensis USBA 355 TaxID=560819 RepID=A0A1Y6C710_9PROT|nr:acyltransferase [Tistlia consotensis]SMF45441.1 transferase hexapeptide (six repeat-containing protein) [Tistlia consotensis USBA 355]SNR79869.1 transferase hexapeptide (six repeat-containing protein) [Tistlia consotensis]
MHLSTGPEGRLVLGERVFLNSGVVVSAQRSIEIGDDCKIGDMTALYDSNFHQIEEGAEVGVAPVRLGRNVWLGRGVVVLPGVTIGDHSVVGAGSVVTAAIPPGVLAAGNPARVLRPLRCSEAFRRR